MTIKDLFDETFYSITSNMSRTGLTILGVVIGIASVISMIAIGQGAQYDIEQRISSLGVNLLQVSPGQVDKIGSILRGTQGTSDTLTLEDSNAIEQSISHLKNVAPSTSTSKQIIYKGSNINASIVGTNEAYADVKMLDVKSGSFLTTSHIDNMSKVAVLGGTAGMDLFGAGIDPIGKKIRIDNQDFTVIGVLKIKGDNNDGSIYAPLEVVQHYFTGKDSVSSISVSVEEAEYMAKAQEEISSLLLQRHKITNPAEADFTITNLADIQDTISATTESFTILLGSVAAISLIVGGIGIMNMMLTIVTERTREIGLRKALGAKRIDINLQFLTEASIITLIGGIIGILVGWGVAYVVQEFTNTTAIVTFDSVVLAFVVSVSIGMIFGYYPAKNASKLDPIDALRYE